MLQRTPFVGLLVWLCAWTGAAYGALPEPTVPAPAAYDTNTLAEQRHALRQERAQLDARLQAAEAACHQRFAVEDCLRAERRQARQKRMALQARENQLNLTERRQRAAQRQQSIEARQRQHTPTVAAISHRATQRHKKAAPRPSASPPPQAIIWAQRQARQQATAQHAAQAQQALQAKQAAAQAHKQQVLRQQAERAQSGKPPAAPLPVPLSR